MLPSLIITNFSHLNTNRFILKYHVLKIASIKELKTELDELSHQDLVSICLRLGRFKKENKELLTYLLFLSNNEEAYIEEVKKEIDVQFEMINRSSYHYVKKSIRKILRNIKRYVK